MSALYYPSFVIFVFLCHLLPAFLTDMSISISYLFCFCVIHLLSFFLIFRMPILHSCYCRSLCFHLSSFPLLFSRFLLRSPFLQSSFSFLAMFYPTISSILNIVFRPLFILFTFISLLHQSRCRSPSYLCSGFEFPFSITYFLTDSTSSYFFHTSLSYFLLLLCSSYFPVHSSHLCLPLYLYSSLSFNLVV